MSIPIPARPSGYRQGQCDAPLQVEVFVDVECPFSKKAWSTLLSVVNHYQPDQVSVTVHPIVLANHRQSWDVTKAVVVMAADNAAKFWDALTYCFERQEKYAHTAFDQQTRKDLYALLAHFAADFSQEADKTAFIQRLKSDRIEKQTKIPVRYAISRGVWSTPTFLINGSQVDQLSSSSSLTDWQDVLDPLLSAR